MTEEAESTNKILTPHESRECLFKYMRDSLEDYRTRLLQLACVVGVQDEAGQFVIGLGIERVKQELAWIQHIRNYFNKRDKTDSNNESN